MLLSQRRLQEKDIEEPLESQAEDLLGSAQHPAVANSRHSDNSNMEEEQEFVSSVVTQGCGRRTVHWDDLPDHKHRDTPERGFVHWQDARSGEPSEEVQRVECGEGIPTEDEMKSHLCKSEAEVDVDNQHVPLNTVDTNGDQTLEDVEKATRNLQLCSLSDAAPHPVDSTPDATSHTDGNPGSHQAAAANLNISQVGMSKRGAAALRDLLSRHAATAKPDTIRLQLLAGLRRTFEEWCTAATQEFLYGTSRAHGGPPPRVSQDGQEEEEELDEDDLADDVTDADGQGASARVADYEKLREEAQQQEQRVRGFYKGAWSSLERVEDTSGEKVSG